MPALALSRRRLGATAHRVPLAAAALQFPLGHPAVVSVVAGMASTVEVAANIELINHPIPSSLWDDLVSERLLHPEARLPAGAQ